MYVNNVNSPLFVIWAVCVLLFCADCWRRRKELGRKIIGLFSTEARQNLKYSCGFGFLFTFITYGFLFANEFFSHDSVQATFYQIGSASGIFRFYLGLGRFLIPLYEKIKGPYSSPWLIGLFFTTWMVFTCFLVVELFRFKGRTTIALVCGLLCANTALILTGATYTYCWDEYAVALLASVLAAYCFCKVPCGKAVGVLMVVFALGIYQPYFTVTLALCFMFAIQRLVRNERMGKVVSDGLKQVGLLLISFGIYYAVWTALCTGFQVTKMRTNETVLGKGISDIITILINSYCGFFKIFLDTKGLLGQAYAVFNICLFILFLGILFRFFQNKSVSRCNQCLVAILVLSAPLVFSSSIIILAGRASELTRYGYELVYIFFLVWLGEDNAVEKTDAERSYAGTTKFIAAILLICVIYNNVLLANQAYMKKTLEKTSTISLVTRIIDRVETLDGYSPNDTQVYIVGELSSSDLNKGNKDVPYLETRQGLWFNYSATYNLAIYITNYLNYPMRVAAKPDLADTNEVKDMPTFPAAGSVKMIDGAAVIKLS